MVSSKEPHYVRVQNALRLLISQGVYKQGDALPSENELSTQFSITRMTVRNALQSLEKDGLILKKKGIGSIVLAKRRSIGLLSIKGFTEIMKDENIQVETIMIKKPSVTAWNDDFFFELNETELAAGCIEMDRVRKINKEAIMYEVTYLPNLNLQKFCTKPFINKSLFDTLHFTYGIEITHVVQKFRAISANAEQAELLGVKKGKPLLHVIRKLKTNRANFYVYSSVLFNSENHLIEL